MSTPIIPSSPSRPQGPVGRTLTQIVRGVGFGRENHPSGGHYCARFHINHSKAFVNPQGHHINGIENFWNQAKQVLRKYNGIPRKNFYLFLKECEFRFNYGSPKQQLSQLKIWANL